jgi:ATP-binding cassette, subfamily B, bacterial
MPTAIPRHVNDAEIITRYTDQPSTMPEKLRKQIEAEWGGLPLQLYALADLSASMLLVANWVALGPEHISIAHGSNGVSQPGMTTIKCSQIKALREMPGLSCNVIMLLGEPGEPALAVLRYTHRQRRAMETIKFVLQQRIDGYEVDVDEPDEVYAGSMAHSVKQAQAAMAGSRYIVVWRLLAYLRPYRVRVACGMIAAVLMTVLSLLPPYVTRYLIDDVVQPFQKGAMDSGAAMRIAWIILVALAASYLLREACHWIRLRVMSVIGEYVARDLRTELYSHLQRLSLNFYSSKQTGSIISRCSNDTDRLWDFVAFGVVEVSLSIIMLVGLSAVLLYMDWRLGLVMTLPVPIMLGSFVLHGRTMKRHFLRMWRKWSAMTAVLSDTIPGMRVVKAFNQEEREVDRFNNKNDGVLVEANTLHSIWTRFWPMLILGLHCMTLGVWMFALPRLLGASEWNTLTIGDFIAFLLYMGMFAYPIETIGMMTRMMNRATSSAMRVFEILDTEPEIRNVASPVKLEPVEGRVVFENVTFAYDGVRQVLRRVSFEVEPGEMIGLVGPSGAGKTTVINLIARFYDTTSGRILIDGVELKNLDTGHYRRQIGMVLQDPHLFHGTILENIRYGAPEANMKQIVEAARAANAHDFICNLSHSYDTVVGERGHTLSGGERQRISIARAILNNPRILILDEATSSVDTETERNIQEALDRLISGRTVFAIAHRLSTLRQASRLMVLEDGRLTEEGTHDELLAKEGGTFKKLSDMQHELHEMYAV